MATDFAARRMLLTVEVPTDVALKKSVEGLTDIVLTRSLDVPTDSALNKSVEGLTDIVLTRSLDVPTDFALNKSLRYR